MDSFPGKVIKAVLEKTHGTTVWDVEILTVDEGIMDVLVDATSVSVIRTEEKLAGMRHSAVSIFREESGDVLHASKFTERGVLWFSSLDWPQWLR